MTEQQYRVIADRDKGDDPEHIDIQTGDRYTLEAVEGFPSDDIVVRIERPVPTTDEPDGDALNAVYTAWRDHGAGREVDSVPEAFNAGWNGHALYARPSLPTREQIAEVTAKTENADYWIDEIAEWNGREQWEREAYAEDRPDGAYEDRDFYLRVADAVLALLQKGADR